ncbi:MAG: DUF4405 domain-containing protein [Ruminococcus sp.]
MKPKAILKLVIDILMTAALLLLMGYQFLPGAAHEWIGAGMFVLFIAHQILNFIWYKNLFKGKYTMVRIISLCVDVLALLSMLALMYSGIILSRHVFGFLTVNGGIAFARRLHMIGSYWGFVLMSIHIGMHWSMILVMLKKAIKIPKQSKIAEIILFVAGLFIAFYGATEFVRYSMAEYLFMQTEFAFLDYAENPILFYMNYLSVMGMFIFAAHCLQKLIKFIQRKK